MSTTLTTAFVFGVVASRVTFTSASLRFGFFALSAAFISASVGTSPVH
ncbi:MAG: hypothetical protein U9532_01345 ['Conium maculatum' witches'-broom phytoplasma]|nr:hypothetical protein ['Conium maculatum' witches'-broom phytoplasma]